jgi:hypothetical protein
VFQNAPYLLFLLTRLSEGFTIDFTSVGSIKLGLFVCSKNKDITLEQFKWIWWMEYGHRMWGRAIGAVFLIPAAVFWARGWFKPGMKKRIVAFGTLIALQVVTATDIKCGFGGLVVSMLASDTQDSRFKPGRSRLIFQVKKSTACLPSEGK